MEGDRGATLLVRLALKSGIDFSKANVLDRWWWIKASWLADELDVEQSRDVFKMEHIQHATAFSYESGSKAFKHHWQHSHKAMVDVYNSYYPWAKQKAPDMRDELKRLRDEWIRVFGNPKDPNVDKLINWTDASWQKIAKENAASGVKFA